MADALFGCLLVIGLISGLRRGFAKEVIAVVALIAATFASVEVYTIAGPFAAERLGLPPSLGYLVGGLGTWALVYFVTILLGRLVWKGARGQSAASRIEDAAGGMANAAAGGTSPGPVTIILKPLPTQAGILYWLDKILGAALGVAKSGVLILVILFAASMLPLGKAGAKVRESQAYGEYKREVEPELLDLDAVRAVRSIGDVVAIADAVKDKPERAKWLAESASLEPLRSYAPLRQLLDDAQLKAAIEAKKYEDVLRHPKVIQILKDRELLRRIASIDWKAVRHELGADDPSAPASEGSGASTGGASGGAGAGSGPSSGSAGASSGTAASGAGTSTGTDAGSKGGKD